MLFKTKPIVVRKGERKKVLWRFSNSLDVTYQFRAEPLDPAAAVSGTVVVHGSNWIFSKVPMAQPLARENEVTKSMWDTLYRVYVEPGCDVTVTFEKTRLNRLTMLVILVAVILSIAWLIFVFTTMF